MFGAALTESTTGVPVGWGYFPATTTSGNMSITQVSSNHADFACWVKDEPQGATLFFVRACALRAGGYFTLGGGVCG